jgi:ABC-type lipoprotein export system ATPase subunit
VLADEPTARLDEENARLTASLLLRAARAYDAAVVCATHDPALLEVGDDELRLD